jgi:hypothetical protein
MPGVFRRPSIHWTTSLAWSQGLVAKAPDDVFRLPCLVTAVSARYSKIYAAPSKEGG